MTEVMTARVGGGAATCYLDLDDADGDTVIGVHLVTSLPEVTVDITKPNGKVISETLPPGDYYRTIQRRLQFSYGTETADWGLSLSAPSTPG